MNYNSYNSKRRLELQNQHNPQLQQLQQLQQQQFQQLQQQQQQQDYDDMIIEEPPFKKHRGVAANLLYKVAEFAAYTSAMASDAISAINTLTGTPTQSTRKNYPYDDEVLQIRTDDDDDESGLYIDKKDESTWGENAENEDEPPPPYDSTWSMPSQLPAALASSSQPEFSSSQQPLTSQLTKSQSQINSRRRQIRVRGRGGRRPMRRKSSSADMRFNSFNTPSSTNTQPENNDEDDIFLKFNCKLGDMIAEGKAALNSKVDVTDVEMMIAEEKERDERIMREFGIQTPIRRARRYTSSSISSDYDYYSSILK